MVLATPKETLLSYVPRVVARHLAAKPDSADTSWVEAFPAAMLFVDIVGFTALTRLLEQRGQQGVEELSLIMNDFWDPLIELVSAYGGDVVKFLGDALLVVWPGAQDDLGAVTCRAAECGIAVAAGFSSFEVSNGLRLSGKPTVVCGDVLVAAVAGLDGRRRVLIAGEPLSQLEAAAAHAHPGYVTLSTRAGALTAGIGKQVVLPDGHFALMDLHAGVQAQTISADRTTLPVDERQLRPYIPETVLTRLDAGQAEWLAEFRTVTVVYANIVGIAYQSATALNELERVMHGLEAVIRRHEGFVKDMRIDDKGTGFVAVFGVPPAAHEDDPLRGVRAGLAIRRTVEELGLGCGVGVATGRMFCGRIGNARRRDYDINGDAMPLAARLMVAAESGAVLCEEETYRATRTRVGFEELPRFMLKGIDHLVSVYRPAGPADTPPLQSSLVGRDSERASLRRLLEDLRAHQGGMVLIEGEPGIGKSHLARTLASDAAAVDIRCVFGVSEASERSTPFHAWRRVFLELFGLDHTADVQTTRRRVLASLEAEPKFSTLAPLLNAVLSVDLPDNEITTHMDGQLLASNTQDLLVHVLHTAAADSPLVLVLEDCQWMDSASWSLVREVSQEVPSILLVLTARTFTGSLPSDYTAPALATTWLRLDRLPAEETRALLCHLLRIPRIADDVVEFVGKRAEGNPFFAQELAYALRDADLIAVVEGECCFASAKPAGQELSLPTTIQGLVTSRIDQLEPSVQLTLKVAAVVGPSFQYEILKAVHPVEADRPHLDNHLKALELADLIRRSAEAPDTRYTFTHAITQEVAYALLPFAQRRYLHHAVAEANELQHAENLAPFLPLLAYNYRLGGDTAKALDYLERAGIQALRLYNNQEAIEFFSAAVALDAERQQQPGQVPDTARQAQWELQLGQALVNLSRYSEGSKHLEAGLALVNRRLPTTVQGRVAGLLGLVVEQLLHRLLPPVFIGRRAGERDRLLPVHRAYVRLGEAYYYSNQSALPLIASVFHVLNTAEQTGSPPELAEGYAEMGALVGLIPFHKLARSYLRRALDAAAEGENILARPIVWIAAGFYYIGVGEWDIARDLFEKLLDLSLTLGDKRRWMDAVSNIISVHELRGDFAPIEALARELLAAAVRQNDPRYQAEALVKTASYQLLVGLPDLAIEHLDRATALFREHAEVVDIPLQREIHGLYAIAHLRQSTPEKAIAAADQAMALTANTHPSHYFLGGYASPADVYVSLWENAAPIAELERTARRACQRLGVYTGVFPIGMPRRRLHEGRCAWQAGKEGPARRAWAAALAAAERLDMRYDQAMTHYQIGLHRSGSETQDNEHLRRACELFEACGAVHDLALARESLARQR